MSGRHALLGTAALALLAASLLPPSAAQAAGRFVAPATIDATGSADVTAQLNSFIASVPDGSTITFPTGARYRIESSLVLDNRHNLTFDGNGATFFATTTGATAVPPGEPGLKLHWPRQRSQWVLRAGSGITMHNLVVRGANPHGGAVPGAYQPIYEEQDGVWVQGTHDVLLDGLTISDTYGDTVSVGGNVGNGTAMPADHVTIQNSDLERAGRQGISVTDATNVVIQHNLITGAALSLFDVEPPTAGAVDKHILFTDNTVGAFNNVLFASRGAGSGVDDVTVEGNHLIGRAALTVDVTAGSTSRHSNIHILNNTSNAAGTQGCGNCPMMRFIRVDGIQVEGNSEPVAHNPLASGIPVRLIQSCGAVIKNNDFPGAAVPYQTDSWPCPA